MLIRQEQPSDYAQVAELVKIAFATTPDDDGSVPDYLNQVRAKPCFIPELALVAEFQGRLAGQIVLYQTQITTVNGALTELLLSPLCTHPDYFGRGIARALIEKACAIARQMEYRAVFLCGDPDFYQKVGFKPSHLYGIYHLRDQSQTAAWSLARELYPGALTNVYGTIDTV